MEFRAFTFSRDKWRGRIAVAGVIFTDESADFGVIIPALQIEQ
jgi:hypothetical protein